MGEAGPAAPPGRPGGGRWLETWFEWGLQRSRLIIMVPVVVLLLASAAAFIYDAGLFIWSMVQVVEHPFPASHRIGLFLLVIDLFLVGATMFIAAIGFYELFVSRVDAGGTMPKWLVMHDLNDLKARVVSMLVLVTAASFVDQVVEFGGGSGILFLGGAVALVIFALTAFLRFGTGRDGA